MSEWPTPYVPPSDPTGSKAAVPEWTRARCLEAGSRLAHALVQLNDGNAKRTNTFADQYLDLVKLYHRDRGDYIDQWAALISKVAQNPDTNRFNEHDFANVHRVAWLKLVRALARLVALSPFIGYPPAANPWADPSQGTAHSMPLPSSHGAFFFEVPNATGYYALTNKDLDGYEGAQVGELVDGPFVVWPPDKAVPPPRS